MTLEEKLYSVAYKDQEPNSRFYKKWWSENSIKLKDLGADELLEFENAYEEAIDSIYDNSEINENDIKIYRSIIIDSSKPLNKNLGIFWTYDKNAAEPYWGNSKGKEVVLCALAPLSSIDLERTLLANMNLALREEREITLKKNSKIKLLSAEGIKVETPMLCAASTEKEIIQAIQKYKENFGKNYYSGFRQMTPSMEKEVIETFSPVTTGFIFRAIRAKNKESINTKDAGIYWTFDPNAPSAYWGDKDDGLFIIVAKAKDSDIDWLGTVEQYMKPQYAESEVRLKKGSSPKIVEIFDDMEPFWDKYARNKTIGELVPEIRETEGRIPLEELTGIKTKNKVMAMNSELETFVYLAGSNYTTYEYFMSKDADEFWEMDNEDGFWSNREEWAKNKEALAVEGGDPSAHFAKAKILPKDTWLIHFTSADPIDIIGSGFKGRDVYILGLTTHYKTGTNSGDLAMAFKWDQIPFSFDQYGKRAVLFQAKESAMAYHHGDEQNQVAFAVDTVHNMWPIHYADGEFVLRDPKTSEDLCVVGGISAIGDFISYIESKRKRKVAASQRVIEALTKVVALRDMADDPTKTGDAIAYFERMLHEIPTAISELRRGTKKKPVTRQLSYNLANILLEDWFDYYFRH